MNVPLKLLNSDENFFVNKISKVICLENTLLVRVTGMVKLVVWHDAYICDIAFQRMQSDSPHNDNNCVEYFGESASGGFTIKRDNGIFL